MGKQAKESKKAVESTPPSGRTTGQARTGERDENYDLISVLYHALQGADTIGKYLADAQDDEELTSFFEETREAYVERANEAKRLLASRLEDSLDEEEEDDEDEEDEE